MFAAQAGAKHVYGVECSGIANTAKTIIKANKFEDVITIVHGKIEEIELPVDKVDIIISEWMGYFLLYESMLDSVIFARNKWLADDGVLMPDQANMYAEIIEDGDYRSDKIDFWDDVYGFDMSCIKEVAITEPMVDIVPKNAVISKPVKIFSIDLYTCTLEELDFESAFQITSLEKDYAHALVVYFDVSFMKTDNCIGFSTSPKHKATHWKQTVFYFDEPLDMRRDDAANFRMKVNRNASNPRDLDIQLDTAFKGEDQSRMYRLR
jgi:protein arginine N-methyltransferase 1